MNENYLLLGRKVKVGSATISLSFSLSLRARSFLALRTRRPFNFFLCSSLTFCKHVSITRLANVLEARGDLKVNDVLWRRVDGAFLNGFLAIYIVSNTARILIIVVLPIDSTLGE